MANKNLDKDLLERFRALDLEKTFTIASSYKSTAVEYLTKNPQYTQVTAIYSKIEDAIEHIGSAAPEELVGKVEQLIGRFLGLLSPLAELHKYVGNGTTDFEVKSNDIFRQLDTLARGLVNGDDDLKAAYALNQLELYYIKNLLKGKGLNEIKELKKELIQNTKESKESAKETKETAKQSKEIVQEVSKVTESGGIRELKSIGKTMKFRYYLSKVIFLLAALFTVLLLLGVSLKSRSCLIGLLNADPFVFYKLLQFIPILLIYTIGFYTLSFFIKEYKKSDIMYIFNENKESIATAFTLLNARDRTDKDQDIKRDLFGKTIDGLYKVPDSIYTASTDGFIHEKIIEKVIDKIPTGGNN